MTKADMFLVQDIHNILDNGYKDVCQPCDA